ncbi:MAG: type IV secretory system conjugative DNA transfer family protein [Methyloprofundus sp.]|nr:type IV secretory system conjugative DNA transfer family protein [Methyloprofundus sp.]
MFNHGLTNYTGEQYLILASGFALNVLIVFLPFGLISVVLESDTYRNIIKLGKGGSARWGGFLCYLKHNMIFCRKAPIYLGRTLRKYDPWPLTQSVGLDEENHMVTIAMTRSGKSTTVIWPNLVKYSYPDSIFVLDPKGEHAIMTSRKRDKQGQQVYVLDPFNLTEGKVTTHSFNPLAEIDIKSSRSKEDIQGISDACIVCSGNTNDTSQHFNELQRSVISGLVAHVMSTQPEEKHNLPAVYDYFIEIGKGEGGFENLIAEMRENNACGNLPQEAALAYDNAGNNERGSIFTSTLNSLKWISSEGMRKHLRHSDFTFEELKTNRTSIYVVLDFDAMATEKQGRYMRVLFNLALHQAHVTPLPQARKEKGRRVLFVLDEVAQLGYMATIEKAFKSHAGSDIKLWVFFQNYTSLKDTYPSYQDMLSASSKQFFGCNDAATASAIEGLVGKYLHKRSDVHEGQKSLLDATEIGEIIGQGKMLQIVTNTKGDNMLLRRKAYIPNPNIKFVRSQSEPANHEPEPEIHAQTEEPPVKSEPSFEFDIKAVRRRWVLPELFNQEDINECYPIMQENTTGDELKQIDFEYKNYWTYAE